MTKTALVTGGSSGIGLEAARLLAQDGCSHVVINGRDLRRGQAACELLSEQVPEARFSFIPVDLAMRGGAQELVAQFQSLGLSSIDVLITCAGGDHLPKLFHQMNVDDIEAVLDHWLISTLTVCRCVLPLMNQGGAIVTVSSDAAKVPTVGETVIGAAMAGIVMFTRSLAMEEKRRGIRINAVTPSLVVGTRAANRIPADPFSQKLFAKAEVMAQLGIPVAADVAQCIAFLASSAASKVTGQVISVNGGISS